MGDSGRPPNPPASAPPAEPPSRSTLVTWGAPGAPQTPQRARRRRSRRRARLSLLTQPHPVELLIQEVARRHAPAAHLREMRDDAMPLERVDEVHFFVVEPLLERAEELPPLVRVCRA